MDLTSLFTTTLEAHREVFTAIDDIREEVVRAGQALINAIQGDKKLLICGNGGSAADSQHFAAELIGRFEKERPGIPAMALTTDTSVLTAIANDYGYESVFEKQVKAIGNPGDVLIGISTSGNSENVARAVKTAEALGLKTIGLLGQDGGRIKSVAGISIVIPCANTARIQEAHSFILHYWASIIERSLFSSRGCHEPSDRF